jgi:hypothetical protein
LAVAPALGDGYASLAALGDVEDFHTMWLACEPGRGRVGPPQVGSALAALARGHYRGGE